MRASINEAISNILNQDYILASSLRFIFFRCSMSVTQNTIDGSMLGSLKSLLGVKFNLLLNTYIEDSQKRMGRMAIAVSKRDFMVINHEAHGLKGSSRNIGAVDFADICEEMETKGRVEDDQELEQLFAIVQQQFAAVCQELKAYL